MQLELAPLCEAILDTVFDELPALMPHVEDVTEVEPGIPGYAWASEHGRIRVGAPLGGGIIYDWDIPGHGPAARHVTTWGDAPALSAFLTAAEAYANLSSDAWDTDAEYGYADYRLVGTDQWEDLEGIVALKASLDIPEAWFLVKVVNFHDADPSGNARRSLKTIEEWLAENCTHDYRRVGWSSGCSTKVGVAFENQNEAFFFHMRWR